jgi:hypothetical protein
MLWAFVGSIEADPKTRHRGFVELLESLLPDPAPSASAAD